METWFPTSWEKKINSRRRQNYLAEPPNYVLDTKEIFVYTQCVLNTGVIYSRICPVCIGPSSTSHVMSSWLGKNKQQHFPMCPLCFATKEIYSHMRPLCIWPQRKFILGCAQYVLTTNEIYSRMCPVCIWPQKNFYSGLCPVCIGHKKSLIATEEIYSQVCLVCIGPKTRLILVCAPQKIILICAHYVFGHRSNLFLYVSSMYLATEKNIFSHVLSMYLTTKEKYSRKCLLRLRV